ncbi:MAG: PEP-CTERM sorting domain-containing protein [Aquabacterium sp.]
MKNIAVAALSLGLLASASVAQAAPVSVDAGQFVLSYDDSFLPGATVSFDAGVITFTNVNVSASSTGGDTEPVIGSSSFNSYLGNPFPIVLTAKAGYKITSVTETVMGGYGLSSPSLSGGSAASIGALSYWLNPVTMDMLGLNVPNDGPHILPEGYEMGSGSMTGSSTLDIAGGLSSVALTSIDFVAIAYAPEAGAGAMSSLTEYKVGAQVTAVPEPEVIGLLLAGLGVVGATMARRRQS